MMSKVTQGDTAQTLLLLQTLTVTFYHFQYSLTKSTLLWVTLCWDRLRVVLNQMINKAILEKWCDGCILLNQKILDSMQHKQSKTISASLLQQTVSIEQHMPTES